MLMEVRLVGSRVVHLGCRVVHYCTHLFRKTAALVWVGLHGPFTREQEDCGDLEKLARKVAFPVRLGSFTCSQSRQVGSMLDEDRHKKG